MNSLRRDKKEEEEKILSEFQNLDKISILQEIKCFNLTPIDIRKCIHILTKFIYLFNQGEIITTQEATNVFFATTKLFQSKNILLRRLVYLCIKHLSSMAQDVIIVTSSLTKDMTGKEDMYRAAAIRTLCSITDSTMMPSIERYMKQAIVDKNPAVSSAALVSALHLSDTMPDIARRWVNEAQVAIMSDNPMVSYHALGLVASVKCSDNLATVKLINNLIHSSLRSPYSLCLLIRHAAKLANEEETEASEPYINFIDSCMRHKSEIVIYEAAHSMVNLKKTPKDLSQAISILQMFISSSKATMRLAGARTLATLTKRHPNLVADCSAELEKLVSDRNVSVATMAVTTLLGIGAESSIDRLMNKIVGFLSEISDEFKIIVVQAVKELCIKYSRKHQKLAAFLATMLRDDGGFNYKAAIVDALIVLIDENPNAKEIGLAHLCEFIEDCEHSSLSIRILNALGRVGPKTRHPSRYIRFIYNRILLECGPVRAAAVTTLSLFGASCKELLPDIIVLLARCSLDDEDEVRDRAVFFKKILESDDSQLISDYILDVKVPNLDLLERSLREYLESSSDKPFDLSTLFTNEPVLKSEEKVPNTEIVKIVSREDFYADQLKIVPGIEKFGRLIKTCMPLELTEPETEYRVNCVKHIFPRHLILQFECVNTLKDQFLEEVYINLGIARYYKNLACVACQQLLYGKQGSVFCVLKFPEVPIETLCSMKATLEFVVYDCDPITGLAVSCRGYADTYSLEKVVIGCPEQFRNRAASDDWEEVWIRASAASEVTDRFALPKTDVAKGAEAVCHQVGLPLGAITGNTIKEIKGGGLFREGTPMLIRAKLEADGGDVIMFFSCRSPRVDVATLVVGAVGS